MKRYGAAILAVIALLAAPLGVPALVAQQHGDAHVQPGGGLPLDPDLFVDFGTERPHQIRLQGGDSSSDSFCYPN